MMRSSGRTKFYWLVRNHSPKKTFQKSLSWPSEVIMTFIMKLLTDIESTCATDNFGVRIRKITAFSVLYDCFTCQLDKPLLVWDNLLTIGWFQLNRNLSKKKRVDTNHSKKLSSGNSTVYPTLNLKNYNY